MTENDNPTEREFLRVSDMLQRRGLRMSEVYQTGLSKVLGGSGGSAAVFYLGEDSFSDARVLVQKIKVMFGRGADTLIAELADRGMEALRSQ